jgi:pimeloyl-ACP methyl ester carboxylesterase
MLTVIIFGSILGGIILLLGAGLLYRTLRQWRQGRMLALKTPNKIEEGRFVPIGGLPQWIQIRGEGRDNPIMLFLHGGPGIVHSAFTPTFRGWEHEFTLVQWDQRGAGKTASRNGHIGKSSLTIEGMVEDGIQVTEWVLQHLNQRKIIIFAISWGTILGTIMIKRRPDLFSAYVGTGQFVNWTTGEPLGYELALERAQKLGDAKSLKALRTIGPPPYPDEKTLIVERRAMGKVGVDTFPNLGDMVSAALFSPGYSLRDSYAFFRGIQSSASKLLEQIQAFDAQQLGTTFETPVFFFQGTLDMYAPTKSVQQYFATLQAPYKELVLWENEGHVTFFSNPEMVRRDLVAHLRPLVTVVR